MATVNFYLKGAISDEKIKLLSKDDNAFLKKQLEKPLQIFLKLSVAGERIQVYTKKRIAQKYWDREKQRADCQKYKTSGSSLNDWLFDLEKQVLGLVENNDNNLKHTTANDLKNILNKKTLSKSSKTDFESYYNEFIAGQKTSDGFSLKKSTIKKYNGMKIHLLEFAASSKRKLDVARIDKDFLIDFKEYLTSIEKTDD